MILNINHSIRIRSQAVWALSQGMSCKHFGKRSVRHLILLNLLTSKTFRKYVIFRVSLQTVKMFFSPLYCFLYSLKILRTSSHKFCWFRMSCWNITRLLLLRLSKVKLYNFYAHTKWTCVYNKFNAYQNIS